MASTSDAARSSATWPPPRWMLSFVAGCLVLAVVAAFYAAGNSGDSFHRGLAGVFSGIMVLLVLVLGWVIIRTRRGSRR